jgi:hypothetical protein
MGRYGLQHQRARIAGDIKGLQRQIARDQAVIAVQQAKIDSIELDVVERTQQLNIVDQALEVLYQANISRTMLVKRGPRCFRCLS